MKEQIPLYSYSGSYAYEHGELKQFHASYQANVACKEAIEQAISDYYGNNRLDAACVDQVVERFGYERVFYVRILCSGRNGMDVFPAIINNGRKQYRSRPVMAVIKTLILLWTAVIPD